MSANGCKISFGSDGNVLDQVMVASYYKYTKNAELYYFKMVNYISIEMYKIKITST